MGSEHPSLTPVHRDDYDDSVAALIYDALKVEVQRAEGRTESQLDVRDLTFRAYVYWYQHAGGADSEAYGISQRLLERALSLAADDFLALKATAEMNLCDCIQAWSNDINKETTIGAAALDKLVRLYPKVPSNSLRLKVLMIRGQYAEAISVSDEALRRDSDDLEALQHRMAALIHLGRVTEALPLTKVLEERNTRNQASISALIAAVEYAAEDYGRSAQHARAATAAMTDDDFKNSTVGPVRLTLAAAEARLGHFAQAQSVMKEFWASVPQARTASEIRHWMYPTADLYGFQPLFDGLRLAGVND